MNKISKSKFILSFWSMKIGEWRAMLKTSQKYLKEKEIEAKDKIAELDRKIKDKEAEFARLGQQETLNGLRYELNKREAELIVKERDVGMVKELQNKIANIEASLARERSLVDSTLAQLVPCPHEIVSCQGKK